MAVSPLVVTTGAFVTWPVTVMQIEWLFYFTQSPTDQHPPLLICQSVLDSATHSPTSLRWKV